jgi:hypothetical protein
VYRTVLGRKYLLNLEEKILQRCPADAIPTIGIDANATVGDVSSDDYGEILVNIQAMLLESLEYANSLNEANTSRSCLVETDFALLEVTSTKNATLLILVPLEAGERVIICCCQDVTSDVLRRSILPAALTVITCYYK